jgi:hypothetical protein
MFTVSRRGKALSVGFDIVDHAGDTLVVHSR